MLMTIFGQLVQQIMPLFVTQRSLYEVRERPSKAYSWRAFMMCNILVEIPWSAFCAVLLYFTWYYPIGLYHNAEPTDAVTERGGLMFLYILSFLLFSCTFAHMAVAAVDTAEAGGNIANLAFMLCLVFCGVLVGPDAFPGFWIFMYRVSPFTYLIDGMLSTAVADTSVTCATNEYLHFNPSQAGQTCAQYMAAYINATGGYVLNPDATEDCSYCQISETNTFLAAVNAHPQHKWRNWGIIWAYIVFNIFGAVFFYWLGRVPKNRGDAKKETASPTGSREGSILSPIPTNQTIPQEKNIESAPPVETVPTTTESPPVTRDLDSEKVAEKDADVR